MRYWSHCLCLALLTVALSPTWVSAHAVGVDCTRRGDKVEVETYYDDDTPAIKAKVQVLNNQAEVVASGITDAKGRWTFSAPPPGKYEVRVDAGAGHRTKRTINVSDESAAIESTPKPAAETISEGPTHAEFTRTPWHNLLLGLAIIGGGGFVLTTFLRKKVTEPRTK